jgi:hypothetical protein
MATVAFCFVMHLRREFEANNIKYEENFIQLCCSLIEEYDIPVRDLVDKLEAKMIGVYSRVKVNVVTSQHLEAVKEQLEIERRPGNCKRDSQTTSVMNPLDVVRSKLTPQQLTIVQYSSLRPLAVIAGAGNSTCIPHTAFRSTKYHYRIRKDADNRCAMCSLDNLLQDESVEYIGFSIYPQGR